MDDVWIKYKDLLVFSRWIFQYVLSCLHVDSGVFFFIYISNKLLLE